MLKAKRLSKLAAAANSAPLLKPNSAPSGDDKACRLRSAFRSPSAPGSFLFPNA